MRHAGFTPEALSALRDTNRLRTVLAAGLAGPSGAVNISRLRTGLAAGL